MKLIRYVAVAGLLGLGACDLNVLGSEVDYNEEEILLPTGVPLVAAGMLKTGFGAVDSFWYMAGLVGNLEVRAVSAGSSSAEITREGRALATSALNRSAADQAYRALALADRVLAGVDQNTFAPTPEGDARAKALLTANARFMQGLIYATMARYYESVVEFGTGETLTPQQAMQRGIELLRQAETSWNQYRASTAPVGMATTGLVIGDSRFVNSYVAVLLFDTGARDEAAALLPNAYTAADAATQVSMRVITNAIVGPGVYPSLHNYFITSAITFSESFVQERIPGDTLRGTPRNWFSGAGASFFVPEGRWPLVTWQEIALMRAELTADPEQRRALIQSVLTSWNIPAAEAAALAQNPAITPQRIARYAYLAKGRAWHAAPRARWQVSADLEL